MGKALALWGQSEWDASEKWALQIAPEATRSVTIRKVGKSMVRNGFTETDVARIALPFQPCGSKGQKSGDSQKRTRLVYSGRDYGRAIEPFFFASLPGGQCT